MTLTGLGRATLVLGLMTTLALTAQAQRSRTTPTDPDRDSDSRTGDTETVHKTVPLSATGRLRLHTFSGYVHVIGTNSHEVTIKAVRTADRDILDRVRLTIDGSGSSVSINANDNSDDRRRSRDDESHVVRTDFEIEMPATASLEINGFSSPIEVTDVTGDERLDTFSGRITVAGGRGAVTAHTHSGAVDVDLVAAGASPSLSAHTFSGSIRAKLATTARADVEFNSFSGQFDSDLPLTLRSSHRGRLSGRVGDGSATADLSFETFSGDVRVVR
jgi:hypothetical protein